MILFGITFALDRITFCVSGTAPQRFLSLAAERNLRLWRVHCLQDGSYTALARGADLTALKTLAAGGEWKFSLQRRFGPGPWVARALRRPGMPVGFVLFLILLRFLSGFVWCIDFGTTTPEDQTALRALLAHSGIYEGTRPDTDALADVRRQAAAQTDRYGWVSINFTGGCLAIESTPSRFETIAPPVPDAALYAVAEGKVLRVETESGFCLVAPGQYVAEGQLLVDHLRTRRSGTTFKQGASGTVIARIVRSYTATQPVTVTAAVPSSKRLESSTLHFMGQEKQLLPPLAAAEGTTLTEWLPLRIGRVALPACLYRLTLWPRQNKTLHYSTAQTAALAARACYRQLMSEFPDAKIEAQQRTEDITAQGAHCTLRYTFCANIAKPR